MITKEQVKEVAQNLYATEHGRTSFEVGAMWSLAQLDQTCNKDFTIIPGTSAAIYWPSIDPRFKFVTVGFYGFVKAYMSRPVNNPTDDFWSSHQSDCLLLLQIRGNFNNWRNLIFERPE